jgi:DNA-binding Xre family transcriptional regulator
MQSNVGKLIHRLQAKNNLSSVELARRLGIKIQNVHKLKSRTQLRPTTIYKLSKVFNCEVDVFLDVSR